MGVLAIVYFVLHYCTYIIVYVPSQLGASVHILEVLEQFSVFQGFAGVFDMLPCGLNNS